MSRVEVADAEGVGRGRAQGEGYPQFRQPRVLCVHVGKPGQPQGDLKGLVDPLRRDVIEGIRSSINVFRDRRPELYKVST